MFCGSSACFQRAHGVERLGAELGLQIFLLALPDAVLAGAGAVHRLRALDQAVHELLAARHLVGIVDVAEQRAVEIAVADMADDRRQQIEPLQVVLGLGDAIGEPRDRHADVGRDHAARRDAAPSPTNRRHAAPATAWCDPPAAWSR